MHLVAKWGCKGGIKMNIELHNELRESIIAVEEDIQRMKNQCINIEKIMSTKAIYAIMHQKVSLEYFEMTKRTNTNQ